MFFKIPSALHIPHCSQFTDEVLLFSNFRLSSSSCTALEQLGSLSGKSFFFFFFFCLQLPYLPVWISQLQTIVFYFPEQHPPFFFQDVVSISLICMNCHDYAGKIVISVVFNTFLNCQIDYYSKFTLSTLFCTRFRVKRVEFTLFPMALVRLNATDEV